MDDYRFFRESMGTERKLQYRKSGDDEWKDAPPEMLELLGVQALVDENTRLRAALFDLLDMCDVQARNDGVLTLLRKAMEQARKALEGEDVLK